MRSPLLALTFGLLIAGCGDSPTTSTTPSGGPSVLTQPEERFVGAIKAAIPDTPDYWNDATSVKAGYAACTSLNADGGNPELAVTAVRSDTFDDATARVIVRTAVDDLCPAASAAGLSPTAPANTNSPAPSNVPTTTQLTITVHSVRGDFGDYIVDLHDGNVAKQTTFNADKKGQWTKTITVPIDSMVKLDIARIGATCDISDGSGATLVHTARTAALSARDQVIKVRYTKERV